MIIILFLVFSDSVAKVVVKSTQALPKVSKKVPSKRTPTTREDALLQMAELPEAFRFPARSPFDISRALDENLSDEQKYELIQKLYKPSGAELKEHFVEYGEKIKRKRYFCRFFILPFLVMPIMNGWKRISRS